jgi:hypothetical protein
MITASIRRLQSNPHVTLEDLPLRVCHGRLPQRRPSIRLSRSEQPGRPRQHPHAGTCPSCLSAHIPWPRTKHKSRHPVRAKKTGPERRAIQPPLLGRSARAERMGSLALAYRCCAQHPGLEVVILLRRNPRLPHLSQPCVCPASLA